MVWFTSSSRESPFHRSSISVLMMRSTLSFLANMTATVFMLLNLNAVMSVIANVPAAVISTVRILPSIATTYPSIFTNFTSCATYTSFLYRSYQIVACRVVRRLNNFANQGPEVFTFVRTVHPAPPSSLTRLLPLSPACFALLCSVHFAIQIEFTFD